MPALPSSEAPGQLVSIDELLWLHSRAIEDFGGAEGVRDRGALESALARPAAAFGGMPAYNDAFDRVAALLESVVQNHGFVDGNKRTAVMAAGLWLEREGHSLEAERGELVDLALAIAGRQMPREEISSWLRARTRGIEAAREPAAIEREVQAGRGRALER